MKEYVYDFNEFKGKISKLHPIHHYCTVCCPDGEQAIIYELIFRIYGISNETGHIIIFESKRKLNTLSKEFNEKWSEENYHDRLNAAVKDTFKELTRTYAAPLKSTEGRLE
jgi:hypothetical protein